MNIFVGNLSRDVTEDDLRNAFGAYGQVDKVSVLRDKFTGEPRGFGFVEMASKGEAEAAIAGMNKKDLKGRSLNVNEARPKTDRAPGGGGAGRGYGGGGGRGGFGGGRSSSGPRGGGRRPY